MKKKKKGKFQEKKGDANVVAMGHCWPCTPDDDKIRTITENIDPWQT